MGRNNHIGGEKSNLIFHFNFFHLGPNFQSFYHCKMSDADWDAEDYEPPKATAAVTPRVADRWEGDDDVKDSWDKESDEEDDSKGSEDSVKAVQRKKKLQDIIAEKEAAKMKELEEKMQRQAEEEAANTPEGKKAQKLKQKQQDEKASLELAMDMMGVSSRPSGSGIDAMVPDSKDDFEKLQKAISEKVQSLSGSSHYNDFVEDLIKDLSLDQPATTLKKLKIHIETLHSTKRKKKRRNRQNGLVKGHFRRQWGRRLR